MNFSFCLITKNEEKNIEKCLEPIKNLNMEIVVVDTGSTDRTKELAGKYTNRIYDFEWVNDFSKARNFAIEKASNDYVFFLDSDEFTTDYDLKKLFEYAKDFPGAIGQITRRNKCFSQNGDCIYVDYVERFFNRKLFYYTGSIHEQVTSRNNAPLEAYHMDWTVYHEGYYLTPEELKNKGLRNAAMLLKELEDNKDDPYIYYQLGQSYELFNDYEKALYYYEQGLNLKPDSSIKYVEIMTIGYGGVLNSLKKYNSALCLENRFPNYMRNADFVSMLAYAAMNSGNLVKAISLYKKATECKEYDTEGANSFLSYHNLACIYKALGNYREAIASFEKALPYERSKKALEEYIKELSTEAVAPVLSVIVILKNEQEYLPLLIQNLKEQTLGICKMQLILIDNCSSDNTYKIMEDFEKEYSDNVILIRSETEKNIDELCGLGYSYTSCPLIYFITGRVLAAKDCFRLLVTLAAGSGSMIASGAVCTNSPGSLNTNEIDDNLLEINAYTLSLTDMPTKQYYKETLTKMNADGFYLSASLFNAELFNNENIIFSEKAGASGHSLLYESACSYASSASIVENICFIRMS